MELVASDAAVNAIILLKRLRRPKLWQIEVAFLGVAIVGGICWQVVSLIIDLWVR